MTSQCHKIVYDRFGWRGHQCARPATVERNGRWWCTSHDPEAVATKQQKQREKYDARRQRRDRIVQEAITLCTRLGVQGHVNYDGVIPTETVVIAFEDAERLARELGR